MRSVAHGHFRLPDAELDHLLPQGDDVEGVALLVIPQGDRPSLVALRAETLGKDGEAIELQQILLTSRTRTRRLAAVWRRVDPTHERKGSRWT